MIQAKGVVVRPASRGDAAAMRDIYNAAIAERGSTFETEPRSAEGKGFHKMIGKLFTDNAASLRLVDRCGFATVGLHRCHGQLEGTWRDVLVVEQLLGPDALPAKGRAKELSARAP